MADKLTLDTKGASPAPETTLAPAAAKAEPAPRVEMILLREGIFLPGPVEDLNLADEAQIIRIEGSGATQMVKLRKSADDENGPGVMVPRVIADKLAKARQARPVRF